MVGGRLPFFFLSALFPPAAMGNTLHFPKPVGLYSSFTLLFLLFFFLFFTFAFFKTLCRNYSV